MTKFEKATSLENKEKLFYNNKEAFSLVELSIVLVILGLLTGGILTGQNLIRAAELRSLTTQISHFQTATHSFREKYFALPGDMANATAFWGFAGGTTGTDNACYQSTTATGTETCNGNSNGSINDAAAASEFGEKFMFWQHLANAGMIEGSYTGVAGTSDEDDADIGENVPAAKLSNVGWWATTSESAYTFTFNTPDNNGSTFVVGRNNASGVINQPFLTPEEAWNIDTKLDDGKPAYGKIVARYNASFPCTDAANTNDVDVDYNLDSDATNCMIHVMDAF